MASRYRGPQSPAPQGDQGARPVKDAPPPPMPAFLALGLVVAVFALRALAGAPVFWLIAALLAALGFFLLASPRALRLQAELAPGGPPLPLDALAALSLALAYGVAARAGGYSFLEALFFAALAGGLALGAFGLNLAALRALWARMKAPPPPPSPPMEGPK